MPVLHSQVLGINYGVVLLPGGAVLGVVEARGGT